MAFEYLNIPQESAYPTPYSGSPLLTILLLSLTAQKHSPNTKTNFKETYDYVVVGAGSAGSVVASRLSEKPCMSVLLLEAGKPPPRLTDVPAIARSFVNTDLDWKFVTAPLKYAGFGHINRSIPWPAGKTLGGSSTFNGMLFERGNRKNYDQWAKLGATGWRYRDVLPFFKKLENNTNSTYENSYRGICGPITASNVDYYPLKKRAAITAIRNEGYQFVDANGEKQNGFCDYQASIRRGQRCGTAKGYLVPAEDRINLDIVPNAMVTKILIQNKKAVGVQFRYNGTLRQVKARREVILSAGTVNTAQLLMLSGIGPKDDLKKLNISVEADLPVGLGLTDHIATALSFVVNKSLTTFDDDIRSNASIRQYVFEKNGPLSDAEGFLLTSALSKSKNGNDGDPVYAIYLSDPEIALFGEQRFTPEVIRVLGPSANFTTITCVIQILNPKSRGNVTLRSANPFDPPIIDPNYYENPQDVKDVVDGMKVCLRIMNNTAMKDIGAKLLDIPVPGCEDLPFASDDYFACVTKTIVLSPSNRVGTARMGSIKESTTVTDPQLRVKGIQGLRVIDASIMPTIPWCSINIPTIMVAEKASNMITKLIQCRTPDYPLRERETCLRDRRNRNQGG